MAWRSRWNGSSDCWSANQCLKLDSALRLRRRIAGEVSRSCSRIEGSRMVGLKTVMLDLSAAAYL